MNLKGYQLQFITHYTERYSYIDSARMALEGGCRWIQLRMKGAEDTLLEETALVIQGMCQEYGATFIIDDKVELALKIKADGVHLGKSDMPVDQARRLLGGDFIIGATVNSFEDVLHHLQGDSPDYFGCGPYRFTKCAKWTERARNRGFSCPKLSAESDSEGQILKTIVARDHVNGKDPRRQSWEGFGILPHCQSILYFLTYSHILHLPFTLPVPSEIKAY